METVTFRFRGFPLTEVILDDDGLAAEMIERDESGHVIRRWEKTETPSLDAGDDRESIDA